MTRLLQQRERFDAAAEVLSCKAGTVAVDVLAFARFLKLKIERSSLNLIVSNSNLPSTYLKTAARMLPGFGNTIAYAVVVLSWPGLPWPDPRERLPRAFGSELEKA